MLLALPLGRRMAALKEALITSGLLCYAGYHTAALWGGAVAAATAD